MAMKDTIEVTDDGDYPNCDSVYVDLTERGYIRLGQDPDTLVLHPEQFAEVVDAVRKLRAKED